MRICRRTYRNMNLAIDVDRVIAISTPIPTPPPTPLPVIELPEAKKIPVKTETTEAHMIAHVRSIFDLAGTKVEKATAERVIKKFEAHVAKQK